MEDNYSWITFCLSFIRLGKCWVNWWFALIKWIKKNNRNAPIGATIRSWHHPIYKTTKQGSTTLGFKTRRSSEPFDWSPVDPITTAKSNLRSFLVITRHKTIAFLAHDTNLLSMQYSLLTTFSCAFQLLLWTDIIGPSSIPNLEVICLQKS